MDESRGLPRGLYTYHQLVIKEARGTQVLDEQNRSFLDMTSGLGVLNLGHGDPRILAAIQDQTRSLVHMCAHVTLHRPYLELTDRLNIIAPTEGPRKTFLCNSGAEAVENAVRIARYATKRRTVLAFHGGYHGRTLLCTTLSGRARPYRKGFAPLAPEIYHIPFAYCYRCPWEYEPHHCNIRCLGALEDLFLTSCPAEEVAAIVVEPIQGEGGVVVPPDPFLEGLVRVCRHRGILLIADEIQTGIGRTGRTFAVEHTGVRPDILILGKALGGGFPLAAVTGSATVMDSVHGSGLGSTFGGNPVACASGLEGLKILQEDGLLRRADEIWLRFEAKARHWQSIFPWIGDVRGRGAMLGIEIVRDKNTREPAVLETREVIRACLERGVIVISGGLYRNVIRLLPPLTISWEELETGLDALESSLREVFATSE